MRDEGSGMRQYVSVRNEDLIIYISVGWAATQPTLTPTDYFLIFTGILASRASSRNLFILAPGRRRELSLDGLMR